MKKLTEFEWQLLQNGAVNLYKKVSIFEEDCKELIKLGYNVCEIDCSSISNFITDITHALNWEGQFGYSPWNGNLNALNDAMRATSLGNQGKFSLACRKFHKLVEADELLAMKFLHYLELNSRGHLLEGCLFVGLIQTENPYFDTEPLGGSSANWNNREWLMKDRGIQS